MRNRSLILILGLLCAFSTLSFAAEVKEADLAGSWYPSSKAQLENQLKNYLDAANPEKIDGQILAIIVPHAGYIYSGPVAAYGYKAIKDKGIKTVIILGFTHRKHLDGVSVYGGDFWKTPLGETAIDTAMAKTITSANPRFRFQKELFDNENSVEMQIPFIQAVLGDVKIVPVAFGSQNYSDAQALAEVIGGLIKDRGDCLIIASTDMSHYHPYQEANSIDQHAISVLKKLKAKELYDESSMRICEMCGLMPVTTTLLLAEKLGYDKIKTLKYANSGDITGDKSRVVGYLSAAIYKGNGKQGMGYGEKEEKSLLNESQRKRLLQIARESITSYVRDGKRKDFAESDPALNKPLGAFVTLHERGELRGCIGNMVGQGPLYKTVADMAIEAATGDPRFSPLSPDEINKIDIEISVLSPLKKVNNADEINIPGDGVIIRQGFRSGVYLPQVALETGWDKQEFLTSLCAHKAGLPPDAWKDPATDIYKFTAEVFGEGGK